MNSQERRHALYVACIFAFRMLGLFMVLPVLALYTKKIDGATPALIGVALGSYGLAQAILQIPFGMWSDKIGRKPVITLGLILFIAGSIIAALSHSIYGIIIGRTIQGCGAIGSTTLALMADITRPEKRTQAMAMIGMTIGTAFFIAMTIGPMINHWFHLSGIFWVTAIFASLGLVILWGALPTPKTHDVHQDIETVPARFKAALTNPDLVRLNIGILAQHATLTALFLAIPTILQHVIKLEPGHQAYFYLPIMIPAFFFMVPFIIIAEKKRKMKAVFVGMICTLLASVLLIQAGRDSAWAVGAALFVFFTAFSALEALLPSLVSKFSPPQNKGTAMGIYSSFQFLGIFLGGALGGMIMQHFQIQGLFSFITIMLIFWLLTARRMQHPPHLATKILDFNSVAKPKWDKLLQQIKDMSGVAEVQIIENTGVAYLKVDNKIVQKDLIDSLVKQSEK